MISKNLQTNWSNQKLIEPQERSQLQISFRLREKSFKTRFISLQIWFSKSQNKQSSGFYKYENLNKFMESPDQAEQVPQCSSSSVIIKSNHFCPFQTEEVPILPVQKLSRAWNRLKLYQTRTLASIYSWQLKVLIVQSSTGIPSLA